MAVISVRLELTPAPGPVAPRDVIDKVSDLIADDIHANQNIVNQDVSTNLRTGHIVVAMDITLEAGEFDIDGVWRAMSYLRSALHSAGMDTAAWPTAHEFVRTLQPSVGGRALVA